LKPFRPAWLFIAIVTFVASATSGAGAATPGGTSVLNTVSATYSNGNGDTFATVSNTVTATVAAVTAVGVAPNENGCNAQTDGFAVGSNVSRTFAVSNNSNISDAYTIAASTTGGSIASIGLTSNGATTIANDGVTPVLAPGASAQVTVTIATPNVPAGTSVAITLKATSTVTKAANGQATSSASQCAIALGRVVIGGMAGPQSLVRKLVDNVPFESVTAAQTVKYSIEFINYGGLPAQNAVLSDVFPAGVTPGISSIQLNGVPQTTGVTLVGQTLTVALGSLAPAVAYKVTISAIVSPGVAIGSEAINNAFVSASNASTATSSPAVIIAGVANVVYDGYAGSSVPVAVAIVSLVDPVTGLPIALTGTPTAPNTANTDPYTTGASGTYAFGLGNARIGPLTYDVVITAPAYRTRRIAVTLTPDPTNTYFSITLAALDGQPLAVPGGFALTTGPVTIAAISNLLGNLPLFRTQTITITKQVDRTVASSGDRLVYTLNFANVGTLLGATTLVDTLPAGVAYAPGTAIVDGAHVEPTVSGRTLTFTFASLQTKRAIVYATVVVPGVTVGSTLTNVATVSAIPVNAPTQSVSATASVDTQVINGIFTDQTIITGRVFVDLARDGWFHKGDGGIPSVRIFLEDGESVLTDPNGRYSFPGVRPGMHVLKLDRQTLPPSTKAYDIHDYDDQKSIRRLVHGVFDGGVIQDVNFAIEPVR
jgi:uncharacterized repeat protein (TIGR01451 family)